MDGQAQSTQIQAPMSLEAEQAVLGGILLEPKAFFSVASILQAEDFFLKRHEYIWNAFSRLQERNDAIDYVTLSGELRDMGLLDEVGGQAYLTSLVNNTPTAIHVEVYGEMVARTSTRRKMLGAADNIRQVALDEAMSINTVVDEAEQALFAVTNRQVKSEFVTIEEAASEYYDELERLLEIGVGAIGMPTGFKDLDLLLGGFHKSDLIVFAGRPGMGKTSWMLSVALNVARRDRRIAIFTMEMGVEQMVQRLISMEAGIHIQQLRRANISAREHTRLTETIGRISNLHIFIDDTPSISPVEMRTKCRRLQHEYGLDIVMVDYMQLMSAGRAYENNRVQEISYISRSLKELARELNVTVLSTAQLSRAVEQRDDKRPLLSDLRESGTIEQDADAVLFLYRDAVYNPDTTEFPSQAQVILSKHRHGPTGSVHLEFDKSYTRFKDVKKVNLNLADISNLD
ncbi:MAG: replicative DNA helicase [Chloroflexi bacterium]|nr:replicative DNA helicase [Chloroflexota bacterium]